MVILLIEQLKNVLIYVLEVVMQIQLQGFVNHHAAQDSLLILVIIHANLIVR
jgi:hypothetical protein